MSRFSRRSVLILLSSCTLNCLMACQQVSAQQGQQKAVAEKPSDQDWYYGETAKQPEKKSIGRLKSEKRAEQRMARLEAMRWYGFSAARPTAAAMPFTSMYSPTWTRAGGRPFAWYTGQRPIATPRYYPYR